MKSVSIANEIVSLKGLVMGLAYGDGEDDDFDAIVAINRTIEAIESEVTKIESERDRQTEQASKLRRMLGDDLNRMCDLAGME